MGFAPEWLIWAPCMTSFTLQTLSTESAFGAGKPEAVLRMVIGGYAAASRRAACMPGLLAAHHLHPGTVVVAARGACGGRFGRQVRLRPVRLPGQGQGDDRAYAAARGDPQAYRGQLGPQGKDQGGARPHGDRSAGDDYAGQQPDHDPHPARSRPARQRRGFPRLCVWLTALMTGPGPPPGDGRAGRPSGANPVGARAFMSAASSPGVAEPPEGRAWRVPARSRGTQSGRLRWG
jgi:hypothetical protein